MSLVYGSCVGPCSPSASLQKTSLILLPSEPQIQHCLVSGAGWSVSCAFNCGICLAGPVDAGTPGIQPSVVSTASYLVPFFFEKVLLTLRCRLLSSKAANPPLSRVTVSSMLEMPLPRAGRESQQSLSRESDAVTQGWAS